MVPRKLMETLFARFWVLIIPVILAPAAVLMLKETTSEYQSFSTVWVDRSLGGAALVGDGPSWFSPAQHQATALSDLLSTQKFRAAVATRAGLVTSDDSPVYVSQVAWNMTIWTEAIGTNLIAVRARSEDPEIAAALVDATTTEFGLRFEAELSRSAEAEIAYYEQQLSQANEELREREMALAAYVEENPDVTRSITRAELDINYRVLVGRVEQQLELVNAFTEAVQAVDRRVASGPEAFASSFLVQDPPQVPRDPIPVSMVQRAGLPLAGMLLGFLISATYLYVTYRTDHTIGSAEDLRELDVPFLGSVPELHPAAGLSATFPLSLIARLRRRDFARHMATSIGEETITQPAVIETNGRSNHA